MSPQEALKLLDQAAAAASSNRSGHATLLEAVKVLDQLITTTSGPAQQTVVDKPCNG